MIIGLCVIELHIPEAQSLKSKRSVVKSVIEKIRHRHNVAVSEVDFHDLWQRAQIGVVTIGMVRSKIEALFEKIADDLERSGRAVLVKHEIEFIE